jgi:hypothetical protein
VAAVAAGATTASGARNPSSRSRTSMSGSTPPPTRPPRC